MAARSAALDALIPTTKGNTKFVLSILVGYNDFAAGDSTSTHLTNLAAYIDARRAARWDKIILCTHTPSTTAGFEAWRNTVDAAYAGWVGGRVDVLCDFHSDATMGPSSAAADTAKFSDGIHPTQAGQNSLELIIRSTILAQF